MWEKNSKPNKEKKKKKRKFYLDQILHRIIGDIGSFSKRMDFVCFCFFGQKKKKKRERERERERERIWNRRTQVRGFLIGNTVYNRKQAITQCFAISLGFNSVVFVSSMAGVMFSSMSVVRVMEPVRERERERECEKVTNARCQRNTECSVH